ncbi:MAG TPA: site-specific integrase [Solirubrobacteraceae bacterium]
MTEREQVERTGHREDHPLSGRRARRAVWTRRGRQSVVDYAWRLSYLHPFFDRYGVSEITVRVVDRFRDELADQSETIRQAQERGKPMMEEVSDKHGRMSRRRRRPLSNRSTNMLLTLLGQILQQACNYELISSNPVPVKGRFLKQPKEKKTFLEIDEFHSLLEAAAQLEEEARRNIRGLGRRAMVATLGLAGQRVSEMLDLRVSNVDLHRARFKLPDSKTPAGVREVEITMFLLAYVADRRSRGLPPWTRGLLLRDKLRPPARPGPLPRSDPGTRDREGERNRLAAGLMPMTDGITPHALRRTWADEAM